MKKELKLFDYQNEAIESARSFFRSKEKSVMLYAPTGAGKTEVSIYLMNLAKTKGNRSAMVMDRIVLCDQTSERLDKYGIDHGVIQSGHWRYRPYEQIQVCSAATLEKRGSFPDLSLLIVDEAHQTRSQTAEFIKNTKAKTIGLSATPFTKGLKKIYSHVINVTTTEKLVNKGQLVPLEVFISKEVDMTSVKAGSGEWTEEQASNESMKIVGDVVTEWLANCKKVFGKPVKTVVFGSSVAHCQELARRFAELGHNFIALSYLDDDEYKQEIIRDFSRPDTEIQGLIATDILTKGFDVPDILCGVSARPFRKSLSSHVQQMGRVMRSYPGKEFGLWIDFSGNYLRFKEDWDDLYLNGVNELDDDREKVRPEKTKEEKEEKICPQCKALWQGGDTCQFCGYHKPRKSMVEEVAGEVVRLEDIVSDKPTMNKPDFYAYCKWMHEFQGWSEKRMIAVYKEYFGVFPRNVSEVPAKQPSLEFENYIQDQVKKYINKQRRTSYWNKSHANNG
jgi:DNA repair protein RadD